MKTRKLKINSGFTLVEALIAIGILALLVGLGLFLSMDVYRGSSFRADEGTLVVLLQKARSRSLNNINQHEHGVKLASGSYIVFQGPGPALTSATRIATLDEVFPTNPNISVSWPAPSEVVFDQLTGGVNLIFLTGDIAIITPERTATISLNTEGRIDW